MTSYMSAPSSASHLKSCTFYNDVGYVSNRNDHAYGWSTREGYITRRSQILHLKIRVYYGSLVKQENFPYMYFTLSRTTIQ